MILQDTVKFVQKKKTASISYGTDHIKLYLFKRRKEAHHAVCN